MLSSCAVHSIFTLTPHVKQLIFGIAGRSNYHPTCYTETPPSFPLAPYRVQVAHHRQAPRITQVATAARYSSILSMLSMLQLFGPQAEVATALQALIGSEKCWLRHQVALGVRITELDLEPNKAWRSSSSAVLRCSTTR